MFDGSPYSFSSYQFPSPSFAAAGTPAESNGASEMLHARLVDVEAHECASLKNPIIGQSCLACM